MDTSSPGYYSRLFLVPKLDGTFRPIIDFKKLNFFLDVPSFKMETLFSIIATLQPQEWITKIDLKDVYHHIPVHVNIRKYFRFVISGKTYHFLVLPFGLSTAPPRVHQNLGTSVSAAPYSGYKSSCLSGRLDYPNRFPRTESSSYSSDHPTVTISPLDYKLEEVYASSLTHTRLLGTPFQSRESNHFSSGLILRFSHQCSILSINVNSHACMQDVIHHQLNLAFHSLYPSWTPTAQVPSVLDKTKLVSAQAVLLGHSTTTGCGISLSPALVQQTGCATGSSSTSSGTQPILLHRSIPNRLGSQLVRSSSIRTVVSSRPLSAHQLDGVRGHLLSHTSVGTSVAQSDGVCIATTARQ